MRLGVQRIAFLPGYRPGDARDPTGQNQTGKGKLASCEAFCTHQGYASSDEASVHLPQSRLWT